jgi:hypothetical protein|tara:strand:+ start:973 stop:1083 length:111 start_codon:yes stop_codon:yes gene_type:complete
MREDNRGDKKKRKPRIVFWTILAVGLWYMNEKVFKK